MANVELHIGVIEFQDTRLLQYTVAVSTKFDRIINILIESLLPRGLSVGEELRHHYKRSSSYCALRQQLGTEKGERGYL